MADIKRVAIIGASGNFGTPITAALQAAGYDLTIITRPDSTTPHPAGLAVKRPEYTLEGLTAAFTGQDAVVCVVGPAGIPLQPLFLDAAAAAGSVRRFVIDDFGWGRHVRVLPEIEAIYAQRLEGWQHAEVLAEKNPAFTWTGIATGNPIDRALKKFPTMGFNIADRTAIIYDDGTEHFTGTTLAGIGQSVVGVLQHPEETKNRVVRVLSIKTNQTELLAAFEKATGQKWQVERSSAKAMFERGRERLKAGTGGWILDLVVAQLYDPGEARSLTAPSWAESDSGLLGVAEESADEVVRKALLEK